MTHRKFIFLKRYYKKISHFHLAIQWSLGLLKKKLFNFVWVIVNILFFKNRKIYFLQKFCRWNLIGAQLDLCWFFTLQFFDFSSICHWILNRNKHFFIRLMYMIRCIIYEEYYPDVCFFYKTVFRAWNDKQLSWKMFFSPATWPARLENKMLIVNTFSLCTIERSRDYLLIG